MEAAEVTSRSSTRGSGTFVALTCIAPLNLAKTIGGAHCDNACVVSGDALRASLLDGEAPCSMTMTLRKVRKESQGVIETTIHSDHCSEVIIVLALVR